MSERIVGRGAELQQVAALLADEAPTARALVLTGDAGVGKTTIWEEGVRLAGERGLRVLSARPAEAEAALPFAALGDLLGPVVDAIELPRPQRAALDRALQRADADEPADKAGRIRALLKRGNRLRFPALTAGTAKVRWYRLRKARKPLLIASGRRTFAAAGSTTIALKLTPAGRRQLKKAKRLRLTARGTFILAHAVPVRAVRRFTLRR
jgi:hypothetical protein